ncbi:zinc finger CCCH domain-containing protein 59-like [Lolium rigidum]|uniref:zinc finger CCCH domain-containing protein 59-like n=1 Tax=Lolium rigidum TaxID=89674 RepID=UPI001F5D7331|nr:zinc finger CCCH domain-containing protein 59-like [Lolium rigidum]
MREVSLERRSPPGASFMTRVNQSTGPFHALLCVGQFFSPEVAEEDIPPRDVADCLEGRADMPILAYFTGDYGPTATRLLLKVAADARGFVLAGRPLQSHGISMAYLSGKRGLGGPSCYSQDDEPGIVDL